MNEAVFPAVQRRVLYAVLIAGAVLLVQIVDLGGARNGLLLGIGLGLGVALYHASFGFTGAYRRAIAEGDISGVTAQLLMIGAAMLLFAPVLSEGRAYGQGVAGALALVILSMAFGAFIFGIGMQLGGGCASGTLFATGSGNPRMAVVLAFFCAGAFWGSLDLHWWVRLPRLGTVSLSRELGWPGALGLQLGALALIYWGLRRYGGRHRRPLWWADGFSWTALLRGPWPLLLGAGLLVLLNWATLLVAGHPWTITWAFSLWAAKVAVALGWDPATSSFWSGGFQQAALARSVLADTTSIMNIGIVLGALAAATLAGRAGSASPIPWSSLAAAVLGGLLMGQTLQR